MLGLASRLLERCELLSRVLRPAFLQLGEPADPVAVSAGRPRSRCVRIPHELDELFGLSLLDQEPRQARRSGRSKGSNPWRRGSPST